MMRVDFRIKMMKNWNRFKFNFMPIPASQNCIASTPGQHRISDEYNTTRNDPSGLCIRWLGCSMSTFIKDSLVHITRHNYAVVFAPIHALNRRAHQPIRTPEVTKDKLWLLNTYPCKPQRCNHSQELWQLSRGETTPRR